MVVGVGARWVHGQRERTSMAASWSALKHNSSWWAVRWLRGVQLLVCHSGYYVLGVLGARSLLGFAWLAFVYTLSVAV